MVRNMCNLWLLIPGALLFGASSVAQQPDYFPLSVGNEWVYRCTGVCDPTGLTLSITRAAQFNDTTYYLLHGLRGNDYWLRQDDSGAIFSYSPDANQEQLWYAFQNPEGQIYSEALPSCCGRALIASRSATYKGPTGEANGALEIHYPGVFQVGIYREIFLPDVGLAHRSEGRGGPAVATYDLIYAKLGGMIVSQPEVAFSLSAAVSTIGPAPTLTARLTLRNAQADPIALTFNSGQIYDLELRNEASDVVFRWSNGRVFTQIIQTISFPPGDTNYVIETALQDRTGKAFPTGKYNVQGWLTAAGPTKAYSASVLVQIP